ncbi:PHP domain-containing protein [Blastococcus sp. Marseille-P5729]|uniref:PHP domain-containing protein n=1 Tax=Blastococcus sp. Marseille-P5729 TaxID=2086582 RepID=UPI001F4800FD|nr:PHP domain-containing protein [Blastococcus sp. Marseille-P5729]
MLSPLPPLEAPVTAEQALRRTAFLLERAMESTYRIEAFRSALKVIIGLDPGELEQRAAAGTLQELEGIGKTTDALISQAVRGELPSYLADLQTDAGPLTESPYTGLLRGDLHMHSDWSDGGSPIQEMAMTAIELDHEYAVLTDHSPRLRIANGLSAARLTQQLRMIDAINALVAPDFRLLKGIEVDILDDGKLDQVPGMLAKLDVVVASVHSRLRMDSRPMTRRMVRAVENPRVNVLGHCTGRMVQGSRGTRPASSFDAEAVFAACHANDVAVEINSRLERQDPPDELIDMALQMGCLFSIDSDAHAPGQLELKAYGALRAERLGIPPDRIVNTWPLDRLLDWATP